MVGTTTEMDVVYQMKVQEPEIFHSMVKMHLSFLLDLQTDECDCSFLYDKQESKMKKAFTPMKKKMNKGVMDGVPLTQEGVCQVYQIIEYLGRNHNIVCEGLFRKHGNLRKQQALKERLNKGVPLNLDDDEFSVHECAAVLKNFLAGLPEPLLTDAYYRAHCQVAMMCQESMTEEDRKSLQEKQISCLQLLFQLIPEVNYALLKDLLEFLHRVSQKQDQNKMSATNLGTVFATHILCPRKLSPEALQSNHQLLGKAVSFMIENAEKLFSVPEPLRLDIENHTKNPSGNSTTPKHKTRKPSAACTPRIDSPVVNTVFSFVDREASKSTTNATDQALAALYAHVQGMPESAQKRKLVMKLNHANGKGTPDVSTSGSVSTVGRRQRRKSGDGLMNLLTPRRKRPTHGSYNFRQPAAAVEEQYSFRRQSSYQPQPVTESVKVFSPSKSSPNLLSPRDRLPSPDETPVSQTSDVCSPVDEVDTPGQHSDQEESERKIVCTGDHDGSFMAPPLPPRTPAPVKPSKEDSPLTTASARLSGKMLEAALTPRSRAPVMVCSSSQLDKWNKLIQRSPSLPETFNEDEPDTDISTDQESDKYFESLAYESDPETYSERKKSSCRTRSLSSEFKQYLASQGLAVPNDSSGLEDSVFDEKDGDLSYSTDVRRLLREGEKLSNSMQAVLDGVDPDDVDDYVLRRKSPRLSTEPSPSSRSRGRRCLPGSPSNDQCSRVSAGSSNYSSTSTLKAADISTEDENTDPNVLDSGERRGRKRRSITEMGPCPIGSQTKGNIFFETDL